MAYEVPAVSLDLIPQAPSINVAMVPAISLGLAPLPAGINIAFIPSTALPLNTQVPAAQQHFAIPLTALTLAVQTPVFLIRARIPVTNLSLTLQNLQVIYDPPVTGQSSAIYRLYLYTDGYDRLELPLSSFQSTRRNGEATYLSVIIPNPVAYLDIITDRVNGEIVLYSGFVLNGTETLTELIRANISSFRYDLGANSGSATITGYKQVTYTDSKIRALNGIGYKGAIDGVKRIRCQPDMWLNPGDTADLGGGESMVVGQISYTIDPKNATMEVIEVES